MTKTTNPLVVHYNAGDHSSHLVSDVVITCGARYWGVVAEDWQQVTCEDCKRRQTAEGIVTGCEDYRWDDPGPDEMMPGCGHEIVDAAGTHDVSAGPAPGRGCER